MKRFSAETTDMVVGKIYVTTNYSKFKIDKRNRPVNIRRATSLYKKLIKNPDLTIEPIVVSNDYTIIDGQHRFWALRKAKMPLHWYMDNKLTIRDAILLNSEGKNWRMVDYVSAYANYGADDYRELMKIYKSYGAYFNISLLAKLMSKKKMAYGGNLSQAVKNGKYKFSFDSSSKICQFLEYLVSLKAQIGIKPSQRIADKMADTLLAWYFNPKVSHQRLSKLITPDWYTHLTRSDNINKFNLGKLYNKHLSSHRINCYLDMNGRFHFAEGSR